MTKLGLCMTGSFCTLKNVLGVLDDIKNSGYDITPIFSFNVAKLDTRFFQHDDFANQVSKITGKTPITSIVDAEPLGTSQPLDIMLVAPCTGNTLAKLAGGVTDTPVTMAVKAHLRNNRPVVLSIASNDSLAANARNLGKLLNTKNIYIVPFGQDSALKKPNSLISNVALILPTLQCALQGKQLQPLLI